MKVQRLLVSELIRNIGLAEEYRSLPVTVRVQMLDGSVKDFDATRAEFHGNSGLLYVIAQER